MSAVRDLRLEMRIRNNLLWNAIFPRWSSVADFTREARAAGFRNVRQTEVGRLLNLKRGPRDARGDLRQGAIGVASFLRMLPEDLFPDELYERIAGRPTSVSVEMSSLAALPGGERELLNLPAPREDEPDRALATLERDDAIRKALQTLTFREREITSMRMGFDGQGGATYREIGDVFHLSVERVRQIEAKAIRKLQHPVRSRRLERFLPGADDGPRRRGRRRLEHNRRVTGDDSYGWSYWCACSRSPWTNWLTKLDALRALRSSCHASEDIATPCPDASREFRRRRR